jgi:hypothetical protein
VKTEDDILHLSNSELPTFGNVLKAADSERFLSFLTAPYIRIPLILDFFANGDPGRLAGLRSKSLQLIVDAALFEPGRWKPADYTDVVREIPILDEEKLHALLSTPLGSMFNEIAKSPDVLTSCITKILTRALDMDVGKYTKKATSGPLILYAIRLAVRVEGFMKLALQACSKPGVPRPRGLESLDNVKIEEALRKLRTLLHQQAFPILEYWIDPSRCSNVDVFCIVHAHLLYLFKNYSYDDVDKHSLSVLLSSQVYLMINHRFSSKAYDDLQDMTDPTKPPPSIQIAQSEIFDIIQKQRYQMLKYMRLHPKDADEAMEAVVRLATGTGTRTKDTDPKIALKIRHWKSIQHPTCYGRFVPDTEDENLRDGSYRKTKPGQTFEDWMLQVTTKAVGIEVNVQISEFTLQNHKMMLLSPHILEHKDFQPTRQIHLNNSTDLACAEVMHTTNRYWWRLVGRRYDLQSWAPDTRNYVDIKKVLNSKFTRKFPDHVKHGERWIRDALFEKAPMILPGVTLYMAPQDHSNLAYVQLAGWIENPRGAETTCTHTLKEVIVWHNPPSINVFNVVEHGRRFFRVLEYASNMSICLHEVEGDPYPDRVAGILSMSAGIPMTTLSPSDSLVVSRALSKSVGNQMYIPKRFMAGLLPTSLIESHSFWQSEDDNITGYKETVMANDDDDEIIQQDSSSTSRLKITLLKEKDRDDSGFCNSKAGAIVQKIVVNSSDPEVEIVDESVPIMTLLDIRTAPPSSLLKRIGMLLSRLDNLSHVLVWSFSKVVSGNDASSIDMIELPRVNLSFKAKRVETVDGNIECRLYSNDHDGLYISTATESREIAEKLLGSISHFIVLQNSDNDLFVLMPGCALPRRLNTDGTALSVQVLLDRRNKEWIDNLGEVRCYLYPVHNSKGTRFVSLADHFSIRSYLIFPFFLILAFLFTPSLASSMYLMVMYFITGSYREVFRMVESCVSEELSAEELQIFNQLEFLGNDFHPDAHACRLKLSAVTVGLGGDSMKCPWSIQGEMKEYVLKHAYVSAACRLTPDEEMLLLQLCSATMRSALYTDLINRKAFVKAVRTVGQIPQGEMVTVNLSLPQPPKFENFDQEEPDTSILKNPKKTMITSKLFGAAYSRPEDAAVAYGGLNALQFINTALMSGIVVSSAQYGFPLLYDLLLGTVAFKIHPNDRPHNWGRYLLRLLPPGDFLHHSAEMSALRLLAENPNIASHPNIPKFQMESSMTKLKKMFNGTDAVSKVIEQLHLFLSKPQMTAMIEHPQMYKESMTSRTTIKLKAPTSYAENRLWAVPRISDYSQNLFNLDVQNCANVNIPSAQLQAFATKPLAPIKLESFINFLDRSQRRLSPVSGSVPFDVRGEKATRTHCSEATSRRIASDVIKYAEQSNVESLPSLIGFSPADIDNLHRSPSAMNKALAQLNSLAKSLNASMFFDRKSLANLMYRALSIASSDERSDVPYAGGAAGECTFLRFRLGQCSEREPSAWFELLVAAILSTSAEHDIRSLNPFLSPTAYKTVTSLTIVSMLTSIRIGQTHRALTG